MGEWEDRASRIAHEMVALTLAVGARTHSFGGDRMTVSADPVEADDNNPEEERHFYVEIDELDHTDSGFVCGIKKTKYEITLTRVTT